MARFHAKIKGNKGSTTRLGSKQSGMYGHLAGWNVGIKIFCFVDEEDNDIIKVWSTGGSNNKTSKQLLVSFNGEEWTKTLTEKL